MRNYYYSNQQKGIDKKTKLFVVKKCERFIRGKNVLDIGYVDELWSKLCLKKGYNLTIIEKNNKHIKQAKKTYKKNKNVEIILYDIEKLHVKKKFNTIILGDVIQYIKKPIALIKKLKTWLRKGGILIITVPNRLSMHRRIGYLLSNDKNHLWINDNEKKMGNLRAYDIKLLRKTLKKSGFKKCIVDACFLKPLASKQIKSWPHSLLKAFETISNEFKEYCWFLYAICKKT